MTPKLTKRQKQLNNIIKLDSFSKCPTYKTYEEMEAKGFDVNEFKEYSFDKDEMPTDGVFANAIFLDKAIEYNPDIIMATGNNGISYIAIQEKEALMAETANFFGLSFNGNQKLLFDMCHTAYMTGEWHIKNDNGETIDIIDVASKYQKFLEVLKEINSIKNYIKIVCPQFDTKQAEYRKQFGKLARELPDIKFFRILDWFFTYYKNLNKLAAAKAEALLCFNLPNIGQREAEKIVEMLNNKEKFHKKK